MKHTVALIVVLGWCACANNLLQRALAAQVHHIDPMRRVW